MIMPRKSKYTIDLNVREGHEGYHNLIKAPPPPGMRALQLQEKKWIAAAAAAVTTTTTSSSASSSSVAIAASTAALSPQPVSSRPPTLTVSQQKALAAKRKNKAMSIAIKPGQQILMNAFMMYMSGNQLNIFSISITSSAILSPLSGLLSVNQVFTGVAGGGSAAASSSDMNVPKLIFIALNLAWLCLGLYKMSSMRLLPTTSADWTHKILFKEMMESTSLPPDDGMMML